MSIASDQRYLMLSKALESILGGDELRGELDRYRMMIASKQTLDQIEETTKRKIAWIFSRDGIPADESDIDVTVETRLLDLGSVEVKITPTIKIAKLEVNIGGLPLDELRTIIERTQNLGYVLQIVEDAFLHKQFAPQQREFLQPLMEADHFPVDVINFLKKTAKDYDCVDNERIAMAGNELEMRAYLNQMSHGCCGSFDTHYIGKDGHCYMVGFNYGH